MRQLGGEGAEATAYIYGKTKEFLFNMKDIDSKSSELDNADIATRIKFSQKAKKFGKEFWRLVREINSLHEKGQLGEAQAKRFGVVLEKLKARKYEEAERELLDFKKLELVSKRLRESEGSFSSLAKDLDSRIGYLEKQLSETEQRADSKELEQKASVYLRVAPILDSYGAWRAGQIAKFKSLPAAKLILACFASDELFTLGFPKPKDAFSLEELGDFLRASKSEATPKRLLEMEGMRQEEIKKSFPDAHQFRRLIGENSDWLASVFGLEHSNFLVFDFGNEERKRLILSAIQTSKEKELASSIQSIASLSRADFENGKAAAAAIARISHDGKKEYNGDFAALHSELSALRDIRKRLPASSRSSES